MQVGLNTRIEFNLRYALDQQLKKEKLANENRSLAQIVAEALELYLAQAEKEGE